MAFKDKYGITIIKDEAIDNLRISYDYEELYEGATRKLQKKYPVLLYTPTMLNTKDHFHIELTRTEARKLKTWLNEYLKENE